jgi:hypothetical protein
VEIAFLHFLEHLAQMIQLYYLHWARVDCLGVLGLWYPFLVKTEFLHFAYAVALLVGLMCVKINSRWWRLAIQLQKYHLVEHLILMVQFLLGYKPTGIGNLFFPRIELHFFYNLMVLFPMMMAMILTKPRGVSI